MVSDERYLVTKRNYLFNSDNSRMINADMLSRVNSYLDAVCKQLTPATSLQVCQVWGHANHTENFG